VEQEAGVWHRNSVGLEVNKILVDTDWSETKTVVMAGIPVGVTSISFHPGTVRWQHVCRPCYSAGFPSQLFDFSYSSERV